RRGIARRARSCRARNGCGTDGIAHSDARRAEQAGRARSRITDCRDVPHGSAKFHGGAVFGRERVFAGFQFEGRYRRVVNGDRSPGASLLNQPNANEVKTGKYIMSNIRPLAILAIAALLAGPASAADSLLEIYQRALQKDPTIREAEATYLALAEVKPQARAALLPSVTANAQAANQFTDTVGPIPLGGGGVGTGSTVRQDSHGWSLSLTQTLFDWGRYTTLRQADKRVARAETDYEVAKQALLIRV